MLLCSNCCLRLIRNVFAPSTVLRSLSNNSRVFAENSHHPEDGKGLKVAVIGCPNVGKSALTNALIRANVCAVSKLIDTTRYNTTTALTEEDCQLVVVDSPGLIGTTHAKNRIGAHTDARILVDPENAIMRAGHVLVVQDVSMPGEYIHHKVLHLLHRYAHIPATLVLNKVDLLGHRADALRLADIYTEGLVDGEPIQRKSVGFGRLESIKAKSREESFNIHHTSSIQNRDEKWHALYNALLQKPAHKCGWAETRKLYKGQNGWPNFKAVFFVSCANGEGIDSLRDHLKQLSQPTTWRFEKDTVSVKQPQKICLEHIRAKFLNMLPAYVAYGLRLHINDWEVETFHDENLQNSPSTPQLKAIVDVNCDKERPARLVLRIVDGVEEEITQELQRLFKIPVALRIRVKVEGKLFIDNSPSWDDDANNAKKAH